ncbi:alpha/beta fold hydrolase [Nodularia harveyana UHCC-0300]|uniref:Alpha/beta fold hydrolase n=1 Tax=Nodularia harveyana UHCC-0300 TaxID=2974287 RepID=A0ABU5UEU5_9CYAN|nr:alpha/beta fold hydrolase [Nodularia harveyana]MEA5581823.1 alpha/beta fold hydrolase [Nodularia harveyana UHCC-0300]
MILFRLGKHLPQISCLQGFVCSLTLAVCWGVSLPLAIAAETITIRLGPFQQSVAIADLEKFSRTGQLPENLEIYSFVLTPQVGKLLNQKLQIEPSFADKFLEQLVRSPQGKQLVSSLESAIPGSTIAGIQAGLYLALRQVNGLSPISFLRAYPPQNITVDATQALQIALAFNANNLQNQAFGLVLAEELLVKNNTSFQPSFDPAARGKNPVQQQTLTLQDRKRGRTIPVDIYFSQTSTPGPLVVISHGFGANRRFFSYLANHLASHGITVAAIEHPGSNSTAINNASRERNLAELLPASEFIDRPKDVSFLLNELEKLNTSSGKLSGKFNTEKVTVIGHSLGGYTALALVGGEVDLKELQQFCKTSLSFSESPGDLFQCVAASLKDSKPDLQDPRVQSAIALNPLVGKLFGKNGISKITKPVLILAGTEDALTPALTHQFRPFQQLRGSKYLLTAIGGTHLSITDPTYPLSATANIVREKRGAETNSLRQLIRGVTLAFIKQDTPQAQIYQQFLTPAYAQSLSTAEIPLRFNSDLPRNIQPWLNLVSSD